MVLLGDSEGPDQTAQMCRLIWVFESTYAQRRIFAWRGPFIKCTEDQGLIYYSQTLLSRTGLFQITAYLEVKI